MSGTPHASRKSWRQQAARETVEKRQIRRILVSGVAITLIAVFVWLVIVMLRPSSTVHIGEYAVRDYGAIQAPPLAFAEEATSDLNGLTRLANGTPAPLVEPFSYPGLAPEIEMPRIPETDRLILYIAAHGISVAETKSKAVGSEPSPIPFLLTSNYDPFESVWGKRLRDVLQEISRTPASFKLLILDFGAIGCDPPQGLLLNEFPRLLDEEVKQLQDPSFWIIASHDLFERSQVSLADRKRVLAYFVATGLAGEADENQDQQVDLAELFQFVSPQVSGWVWSNSGRSQTQTPWLLRAGEGRVKQGWIERAKQERLTFVPPPKPAEKTAAMTPGDHRSLAAGRPRLGIAGPLAITGGALAFQVEASQPPPNKAPQSAPSSAEAESPAPAPESPSPLQAAPADAAEEPAKTESPPIAPPAATNSSETKPPAPVVDNRSPIQRKLDDEWREHDRRTQRTPSDAWIACDFAPQSWRYYQAELVGLSLAVLTLGKEPGPGSLDVELDSLKKLRQEIERQKAAFEAGETPGSYKLAEVVAAVQCRNDLFCELPEFVRWVTLDSIASEEFHLVIGELLRGADELNARINEPVEVSNQATGQVWLQGLIQQTGELNEKRTELRTRIRELIKRITKTVTGDVPDNWLARAQTLLATWLPSGDERVALARQLRLAKPSLAVAAKEIRIPTDDDVANTRQRGWQHLIQMAELQTLLARSLDPASESESRAHLDGNLVALVSQGTSRADVDPKQVATCRACGSAIAGVYRELPRTIRKDLATGDYQHGRQAETLLRLVDARQVDDANLALAGRDAINPLIDLPLADRGLRAAKLDLKIDSPDSSAIRLDSAVPLTWKLHANMTPAAPGTATLNFKKEDLEVKFDSSGKSLAPGESIDVPAFLGNEGTLALLVRALRKGPAVTTLSIDFKFGNDSASSVMKFSLPAPGAVELFVNGQPPTRPANSRRSQIALRVYPGKEKKAKQQFAIQAPASGEKRTIEYELSTLPAEAGAPLVLVQGELVIPPEGGKFPLPLVKPQIAANAGAAPPAAAAVPPGGSETRKEEGVTLGQGLLCRLRDSSAGQNAPWQETEIRIAVLRPDEYLLVPKVRFNQTTKRIEATVRAKSDALLPSDGALVVWDTKDFPLPAPNKPKFLQDHVVRGKESILYAEVEPKRDLLQVVNLSVDGYPRAFCYDVPCDGPDTPVERKRFDSLNALEVVSPVEDQAFRDAQQVTVQLRADARLDGFSDQDYSIAVSLAGNEQVPPFHSDRKIDIRLLEPSAEGECLILAEVKDLEFELDTRAHPDQEVELTAELRQGNNSILTRRRKFKLDNSRPQLSVGQARAVSAIKGSDLKFPVMATDSVSGIKKVEFAVEGETPLELKEPKLAKAAGNGADSYLCTLSTKELEPGTYNVLVRATDHVGFESDIAEVEVNIKAAPTPTTPGAPMPMTNDLTVSVVYGDRAVRGAKVTLEGPKAASATDTQITGSVTFKDLPAGEYKVKAVGTARNSERAGEGSVTVEARPADPATVTVSLQ